MHNLSGMSSSLSALFPGGNSGDGAHPHALNNGGRPPPSTSASTSFKLRPRSNSLHITGLLNSTNDESPMKPCYVQAHVISPDGPMFPSASSTGREGDSNDPPATAATPRMFASMFASGNHCSSPIKKQKIVDQLQLLGQLPSPDSSISRAQGSNLDSPPLGAESASAQVVSSTAAVAFLSSPATDRTASNKSFRVDSLPTNDKHACSSCCSGDTSPFTPKGRLMMQKLCINSLSPSLTSASPTPEKSGDDSQLLPHQNLPTMPTFSFSPSLKLLDKEDYTTSSRNNTTAADSSVRETIAYSVGSTPQGTPKRGGCCPRSSTTTSVCASTSSSPFHSSLRGQMTPIGHQRGSVFKTLPPRLYPMSRDDAESIGTSVNETTSWTCSSLNSASPSPRLVPLTVLSRNNNESPAISPKLPKVLSHGPASSLNHPPAESSPIVLSQRPEVDTNEEEGVDFGMTTSNHFLPSPRLRDIEIPNISKALLQSPLSSNGSGSSHQFLPRIKLTPRGMYNNFAPIISRDAVGGSDGISTSVRRRCDAAQTTTTTNTTTTSCVNRQASSSLVYSPEQDKVASEMDSLLHGFEQQHRSYHDMEVDSRTTYHELLNSTTDDLNRVESEEAEMVALTQGHHHTASDNHRRLRPNNNSLAAMEGQNKRDRNYDKKPMSSITLHMETSCHGDAALSSLLATSPSFLPRPVPIDQGKSRSLFDSSRNSYDRILLADAIAEAARSSEPLTDEDSDIDGDSDFLLCLPRDYHDNGNGSDSKFIAMCHTEKHHSSKPNALGRASSPSFYNRSSSTFPKRRSGDQCLPSQSSQSTLTIFEDCTAMPPKSSSNMRLFDGLMTKHGASEATFATYCSLSDYDASELITSPKYYKMKAVAVSKERHSVCSLLSMSSLCGLDIVHETSQCGGGPDVTNKITPALLSTESHEFSANSFRPLPLTRSEFSMNSLGLSLDSTDAGVESSARDLFTPPTVMNAQNCKRMLSPPPLRLRHNSLYQNWN